MLRPPIHPQAQIILGKYHKREDFRIEVRLPSLSTNRGKEAMHLKEPDFHLQPGWSTRTEPDPDP